MRLGWSQTDHILCLDQEVGYHYTNEVLVNLVPSYVSMLDGGTCY